MKNNDEKPDNDNGLDAVSDMIKKTMGPEYTKENPFVSSRAFMQTVTLFAMLPRMLLRLTSNSGEAVNAILSIMVTFLKNVPEPLWELMRKVANEQAVGNPTHEMFAHLDGLRNYKGDNFYQWSPDDKQDDDITAAFTTKKPTRPV